MKRETKVLIVGLGDLGSKIAIGLATSAAIDELVIAGHTVDAGLALARVASACGDCRVRFVQLNANQRTIEGRWEKSSDGQLWEHDFDLTYTKSELADG